jgi:hypothetical protein
MSQDELLLLLFKVVLIASEAATVAFTVVYSVLAPWWANPIGRTLVQLDILLGLALVPSILSLFWHFNRLTSHIAAWVDVGLFALIALTLFARIPLWIRLHRDKAAQREDGGTEG